MNEKQSLNNLMKGRSREQELFRKREAEMWNVPDESRKLEDVLKRRKKHELDEIRKAYDFKGLSSLKKAELAIELTKLIPHHFGSLLQLLDEDRYLLIRKMVKNDGCMKGTEYSYAATNALMKNALAFPVTKNDERVLVLPDELIDVFKRMEKQLEDHVHRNTEWIQLTKGMLFYYGYVNTKDFLEMIQKYTGEEVDLYRLNQVLRTYQDFEKKIQIDLGGYADFEVEDVESLKKEQKARSTIPYYPFAKEDLLKVGASDEPGPSMSMNPFLQFVRENYEVDEEELRHEAALYESFIKEGESINELIEFFQQSFEVPSIDFIQALSDTFVYANNNTRLWMLKGYKPSELSGNQKPADANSSNEDKVVPFKQSNKVGRNEPCPCGSGKKYKKCCGK